MNSFEVTKAALPGFILEINPDLNAAIEWVEWNIGSELTEEQTTEVTEIFNTHSGS